MEATTDTTDTGLWALTSSGENFEQPATWAWTTVYPTRAQAIAAAEEMAADIRAEGNDLEWDERHLQADDEGGPASTWTYSGEGEAGTLQVAPLRLGASYGETFAD